MQISEIEGGVSSPSWLTTLSGIASGVVNEFGSSLEKVIPAYVDYQAAKLMDYDIQAPTYSGPVTTSQSGQIPQSFQNSSSIIPADWKVFSDVNVSGEVILIGAAALITTILLLRA